MNSNDMRDVTSSAAGTYKFDNLLPGSYEITAEAAGFKSFLESNLILLASTAAAVNLCLDGGSFGQVFGTRNHPRNIQMSMRVTF